MKQAQELLYQQGINSASLPPTDGLLDNNGIMFYIWMHAIATIKSGCVIEL